MLKKLMITICILIGCLIFFTSCDDNHIHEYIDGVCSCGEKDLSFQKVNCAIDRDNELCLDSATWSWDYNKNNWDGKGMVIEVAVDNVNEYDPFSENYSGDRKLDKQSLITKIETEYNIDIVYIYNGGDFSSIKKQMVNGMGDIFLIDSTMIPTLKNDDLIAELYDLEKKMGLFSEYNYIQNENYNLMSMVENKVYGYKTGNHVLDHWLYYNQDLIDQYNLSDPATMWNEGKWTWSAFLELLSKAKEAMDNDEDPNTIWPLAGEHFEVAKGILASRGGQFVKDGNVLLNDDAVTKVYEDLAEIEKLYWAPSSGVGIPFVEGFELFNTGKLDYIENGRWRGSKIDFKISAVPYPRMDEDLELKEYQVPLSYEEMFVIPKTENKENGLTESILFNIMDDLNNGLIPAEKPTVIIVEKNDREYLKQKLSSKESVEAIIDMLYSHYDCAYLEMIDVLSMTMGEGSHYALNGIYPKSSIIIVREDSIPKVILGELQVLYQEELDKLLGVND